MAFKYEIIIPLQNSVDKNNRIHCSLNINTETGRLSGTRIEVGSL